MVVVLFRGGINTSTKTPKTQRWLQKGICLFSLKPSFPEDSTVLEGTEVLKVAGMFALPVMVALVFSIILVIWVSQCSDRKRSRVVGWPLHSVGPLEVVGTHWSLQKALWLCIDEGMGHETETHSWTLVSSGKRNKQLRMLCKWGMSCMNRITSDGEWVQNMLYVGRTQCWVKLFHEFTWCFSWQKALLLGSGTQEL